MEKGKQDLLSKHVHFTSTGEREIQLYACRLRLMMFWLGVNHMKISTPDCHCSPKQYWPFQLPVPHPNKFFSTAELTVNAKRSSLAPSTVDKVVFIHENAHFVNDRFE